MMDKSSRIMELATRISENTTKVNEHLSANGFPQPSFEVDGPTDLTMRSAEAEQARLAAIGASIELQDLLQGPVACLRPAMNATSLEAIYRYDIPRKVPLEGGISFEDLAMKCNMYEPNLRRVIRYAILYHRVFQEPKEGTITHSAASRLLVDDSTMFDALGMMFDESWQAFARTCDAIERYDGQEPNETGFSLAHETNETVWEYYKSHPTRGKRFANAMKSFAATNDGHKLSALVNGYPWSSLPAGSTVVDVGGSEGHASIAIAESHPNLNFVVQDLPEIASNISVEKSVRADVAARITFCGHDFLTEQTVVAEAYLFRWIFHDWPDTYVVKILRNLVPVLKDGARIVVNEQMMPKPGALPQVVERQIRFFDMTMLSLFNSRERELADWQKMFQEADARFGHVTAWTPHGSSFSIIEAQWMPRIQQT